MTDRLEETEVTILRDPGPDRLRRQVRLGPVVVVSERPDAALEVVRHAAYPWAVLPHNAPPDVVRAASQAVAAGLALLPWRLTPSIAELANTEPDEHHEPALESLTPREQDVLQRLAEGLSNRAIAGALGISEHTVKFHLSSIFGKLGAATRTEAVRLGMRQGLVAI